MTLEHALYLAILAVAAIVRFVGLGAEPLSPTESAHAWSAWLAANQVTVANAPAPDSALYYGLHALLFWLFGSGDGLARLLPALASLATVALPWFWRDWLGRHAALVLAALFALDPWLTAWGRRAEPLALTILLALLALTALWRWNFARQPLVAQRWERVGAVSLAFLIASGPWGWAWLPVLLLFVLVYLWRERNYTLQRATFIWFGVALALALTGLTLRPEAIAALSASLTNWIGEVSGAAGAQPLGWPWQRLLLDQPLLTIFGALGVAGLWFSAAQGEGQRRRLAIFVTAWLVWAWFLWLLPGRSVAALPLAGAPLAIAAAMLLGRAVAAPWGELTRLELSTLLVVQSVLVVAALSWLAALVDSVVLNSQVWLTSGLLVALMVGVWGIFGVWAGWRETGRVALLFYAVLLGLMTVRSTWQLNHTVALMQPNGFWSAITSPDVRNLVRDVERLSSIRRGDPNQIDMQVVYDVSPDPVLGWQLRAMRNLRHVGAASVESVQGDSAPGAAPPVLPLVVAPTPRNDTLALPDPYIGARYTTVVRWQPTMLPPANDDGADAQLQWTTFWRPRLQWLLYRKASTPPAGETVTLWAPR
ncbi:MAG TPA: hypothetical protein DCL15_11430 [Chloroflexi bacterium]|nr:hypothetical protein [Chloroflexota bacterium]